MDKIYLTDPKFRRLAILYEFHTGKPMFKCFDSMCDRMGLDFMDYREFEFWFQRFANGNYDIDLDITLEPKTCQLVDLPINVFEMIAGNLRPFSRLLLRKVSKSFRALVDTWEPKLSESVNRIGVRVDHNEIVLSFNENHWEYCYVSEESCVVRYSEDGKFEHDGNHEDVAIDDLISILFHSKLRLSSFTITSGFWTPPGIAKQFGTKFMQKIEKSKGICSRIHAEEVSLDSIDKLGMLKFFHRETLKTLNIGGPGEAQVSLHSAQDEIKNVDLWEKLEEICAYPNILVADDLVSIQAEFKYSRRKILRPSRMWTPQKFCPHSCKDNVQISRSYYRRCLSNCS